MMPVVFTKIEYAFLFRSTFNRKLNNELVRLVPLGPQVNMLNWTVVFAKDLGNMLHP